MWFFSSAPPMTMAAVLFICDTDHTHSNCLTRFKKAFGAHYVDDSLTTGEASDEFIQVIPSTFESHHPACPLCRGEVIGWIIIKELRAYLNKKKRSCQEKHCSFLGNFVELQHHVQWKHPHSHPSEIDPVRQLHWENFQQSSDIIDVLSSIYSQVPNGIVLGDYVIEYDDGDEDGYDEFHARGAKCWASCILYQIFGRFRCHRNKRRSGARNSRQGHLRSSTEVSDDSSPSSVEDGAPAFDQMEEEVVGALDDHSPVASRSALGRHRESNRRRSRHHHEH
ncbi:hypothetical protein HPP92_010464 [Vanilla planifolia]|uniref:Uncharacterized protein n=1 Tax=Vanilla planifolia TaxID=51239 RepID=A0A835V1G2_VANPL|nr:hypothetical protein HPP92_010464 [Vanilla planifolia]